MPKRGQRKCHHCRRLYTPDHRNLRHQKYCSSSACRKARKRGSHRRWRRSSKGRDYFQGDTQVERVRQWRSKNPFYWRKHTRKPRQRPIALQDLLVPELPSDKGVSQRSTAPLPIRALQDVLFTQHDILNGLILKLTGGSAECALQDLIASQRRSLILLARQARTRGPTHAHRQTTPLASKATPDTPSVQLDRPAPGTR